MARSLHKLSDASVKAERKPGRHSDGGGLYLNVGPTGKKSWLFMWVPKGGRRREMGLGAYPTVTLAKSRAWAAECRTAVSEGRDPIVEKSKKAEPTFGECADMFIFSINSEWRNEKHKAQWTMTLSDAYCSSLRPKNVSSITTEDVLAVLKEVWLDKNETASRLRGRIERVLEFAKVKSWRCGENPAAWRGNLRNLLPKRQKLQRGHHAAMPYRDVPAFMETLTTKDAMAARALEFLILTAARSGEVLGATWAEMDMQNAVWTVPGHRMKAGKEHRVPLSPRAVAILIALYETRISRFVFPGHRKDRPLSNMAFGMLMRRMKADEFTAHGFRSAFRDWAGDETNFPRDVAEQALAHRVGDATERAYRRADALDKRRNLMNAWAEFLSISSASNLLHLPTFRRV
jgi:integrase